MKQDPTRARRLSALIIAVLLIGGGASGLGIAHQNPVAVVGSAIAVLVGLQFLWIATRRSDRDQ